MNAKFTKVLAILSALGIMLSFAACGKKDDETTAESTTAETTAEVTTEETTAADGETTAAPAGEETKTPSTKAEILAVYKDVYKTSYAKVGKGVTEDLVVPTIKIDGKEQGAVTKIVNAVKGSLFKPSNGELPPLSWPDQGFNNNGESPLLESDIKSASWKDNGNGTATIKITPVASKNSARGKDAQGRAFNTLGTGISAVVKEFESKGLSWASGNADSNVVLDYDGGYIEVTYNTSNNTITKGYWEMIVNVQVNHATLLVLKDKSLSATLTYKNTYNG